MFHDDEDEVEPPNLPYYDQHTDLDLSFYHRCLNYEPTRFAFYQIKRKRIHKKTDGYENHVTVTILLMIGE